VRLQLDNLYPNFTHRSSQNTLLGVPTGKEKRGYGQALSADERKSQWECTSQTLRREIGVKSHPDEVEGDKSKVKMRRTVMLRWKDKQEAEYQPNSGDDAEGDEKKAKETRSIKRRHMHLSFCFSQLHAYSFHTTYWGFIKETE